MAKWQLESQVGGFPSSSQVVSARQLCLAVVAGQIAVLIIKVEQ